MTIETKPFDIASHLADEDDEFLAAYLDAALEEGGTDLFLAALGDVARAKGISQIARESGLNRESLYKALAPGAKPRFETIEKLAHALGVHLRISHSIRPTQTGSDVSKPVQR